MWRGSKAQHRISAVAADESQAEYLAIPVGTACLLVERQTWREGDGITYVRQLFPGDAYNLLARFFPRIWLNLVWIKNRSFKLRVQAS